MYHVILVSGLILLSLGSRNGEPIPVRRVKCGLPHILLCEKPEIEKVPVIVDTNRACKMCNIDCNYGNNYTSPFTVLPLDNEMGSVEVRYNKLSNSDSLNLEMELRINEELDEEACHTMTKENHNDFKTYLKRKIYLDVCQSINSSDCGSRYSDTIKFKFNNVYTGCYYIVVKRREGERHVTSCPQYIVTNYKKINLNELRPLINHQYSSDFRVLRINVHPSRNETKNLFPNFLRMALMNDDTKAMYNGTFSEKYGLMEYTFGNVTPGNYCFGIRYMDERCMVSNNCLPNINCFWLNAIDVQDWNSSDDWKVEEYKPKTEAHTNVIVGIFVVVMIITIFTVMTTINSMWKKRKKYITPPHYKIKYTSPNDQNEKKLKFSRKRILVLYPQDCNEFMLAMAQFRRVLQRANCQVFDCWDPEQMEAVAIGPNEWVQSLIIDESVKVIVVASKCAELFEEVLLRSVDAEYKWPNGVFHNPFLYGIHCLNQISFLNSYNKTYVVRLQEMCDVNESGLTYLSPLILFKLPLHLENLILAIQNLDSSKHSIILEGIPEVESFREAIDAFNIYRRENPDYLSSILSIKTRDPLGLKCIRNA